MKVVVAAFNQEKALVGAFSVIVQPVVEPMDRFAALHNTLEVKRNIFIIQFHGVIHRIHQGFQLFSSPSMGLKPTFHVLDMLATIYRLQRF